jgi:hypothetical protein
MFLRETFFEKKVSRTLPKNFPAKRKDKVGCKSAQTLSSFFVGKFLKMGFGEGTFSKKFLPR